MHGVLLLDKPLGLSSNDALQKAKWLLRAEKAGHTGTLDPLATGVLPLCFGAATKFSQLQLDAVKRYVAVAELGVTTTTGDAEGEVLLRRPVAVDAAALAAVTERFTGAIEQVPPMHSALKKDGKALYEYARAGIEVERAPRPVEIHALTMRFLPPFSEQNRPLTSVESGVVAIEIEVTCSKGTYIRTLAEDIGEALGCGAHLRALRRTGTGGFGLEGCVTLAELEALPEDERALRLSPVESLLDGHTRVTLDADNAGRFLSGLRRRVRLPDAPQVAVFGEQPDALLGTAWIRAGELIPGRLLSPTDIQQILDATQRQPA